MTVLSVNVVKRPQKERVCNSCGYKLTLDDLQVKMYGMADSSEKPYNIYMHLRCAERSEDTQVLDAIDAYIYN